jgi:hypothetical protein
MMRLRALLVSSLVVITRVRIEAQRPVDAVHLPDRIGVLAAGRLLGYFRDSFQPTTSPASSSAPASMSWFPVITTSTSVPND